MAADLVVLAEDDAPDLVGHAIDLLQRHGALGKVVHAGECAITP